MSFSSFVVNPLLLFELIKEEACVAAVDQVDLINGDNILHLTYLNSTLATGWSTAGVADSNLTKVFLLQSVESVPYKPSEWVFIKVISL